MSCASVSLCLAGADIGFVDLFNGATWTPVGNLPDLGSQTAGTLTSCATPSVCVVMGQQNGTVTVGAA